MSLATAPQSPPEKVKFRDTHKFSDACGFWALVFGSTKFCKLLSTIRTAKANDCHLAASSMLNWVLRNCKKKKEGTKRIFENKGKWSIKLKCECERWRLVAGIGNLRVTQMAFIAALQLLGNEIRRSSWNDKTNYQILKRLNYVLAKYLGKKQKL